MNARRTLRFALLNVCLVLSWHAGAQGFAGLGTDADGFATVERGRPFAFPDDHGPHPGHRIEWWYVTANLIDESGTTLGVQWTLFRQALAPGPQREGWNSQQLWMGHAGVTTPQHHHAAEIFARGGIGQAGVTAAPLNAWIDDWSLAATVTDAPDPAAGLADIRLSARGEEFDYALTLTSDRAPVLQGDAGYSVKSDAGQASYYFSQPFFEAAGTVTIDGVARRVTGRAWMDREWSGQPLGPDQEGWDWFSLHLPDNEKLMMFRLRGDEGGAFHSATWIAADGTTRPIAADAIAMTPLEFASVAGRDVPTRWRLDIEDGRLSVETEAVNPQSWMDTTFSYWEGPIRFSGSHEGVGYLEMTGYAP